MKCIICHTNVKDTDMTYDAMTVAQMKAGPFCFGCNYFNELSEGRYDGKPITGERVVCNGIHWVANRDTPKTPAYMRGMGGVPMYITRMDGTVFRCTDLWHQGDIPAGLREKMPDNAKYVESEFSFRQRMQKTTRTPL